MSEETRQGPLVEENHFLDDDTPPLRQRRLKDRGKAGKKNNLGRGRMAGGSLGRSDARDVNSKDGIRVGGKREIDELRSGTTIISGA